MYLLRWRIETLKWLLDFREGFSCDSRMALAYVHTSLTHITFPAAAPDQSRRNSGVALLTDSRAPLLPRELAGAGQDRQGRRCSGGAQRQGRAGSSAIRGHESIHPRPLPSASPFPHQQSVLPSLLPASTPRPPSFHPPLHLRRPCRSLKISSFFSFSVVFPRPLSVLDLLPSLQRVAFLFTLIVVRRDRGQAAASIRGVASPSQQAGE